MNKKAVLVLADGRIFNGYTFGATGETEGEVVFNTSMAGYQEILTDPSYAGQIITMTYPEIGNYGTNFEDIESKKIWAKGFIVKEESPIVSNFRAKKSLGEYLRENEIVGIHGIDTRALVRHIRNFGAMSGIISTKTANVENLKKRAKAIPSMAGQDLAGLVSSPKTYDWKEGLWNLGEGYSKSDKPKYRIIAYDYGMKLNILRNLVNAGFSVKVVPADTPWKKVIDEKPDGVFLSNGPGDPDAVTYGIKNIENLIGKIPVFGICLGHQMLGIALGGKTYKLKFGHRGGNQPVKNLKTGSIEITSQNHGFSIVEDSLPMKEVEITHINLNDKTIEGIRHKKLQVFSVQYHPESSPGPHDSTYLFRDFAEMIDGFKK